MLVLSALLGVALTTNPLRIAAAGAVVWLAAAFFSCLSMSIAGIVLKRERLLGIGQAITMPLFFASNALYPIALMPAWLRAISHVNPLSYEVDALRGLLLGTPAHIRWTSASSRSPRVRRASASPRACSTVSPAASSHVVLDLTRQVGPDVGRRVGGVRAGLLSVGAGHPLVVPGAKRANRAAVALYGR